MKRPTRPQPNRSGRPPEVLAAIEAATAAERIAQGLPAKCSDATTLAVIANVLREHYSSETKDAATSSSHGIPAQVPPARGTQTAKSG